MTSHYRIIEEKNPLIGDKYYIIQSKFLWVWLSIRGYGVFWSIEDAEKEIIKLHPRSKRIVKTFEFTEKILWD
jgi:hypothetical protein